MNTNYDWAKGCATSNEVIDKLLEDKDFSLRTVILEEMMTDDCDDTRKLLYDYRNSSIEDKAVIDATLINLTGWSLKSLIEEEKNE